MTTFDDTRTITLSIAQWLSVQCAMTQASDSYKAEGFPSLAADTWNLKGEIYRQLDGAIDEASAGILTGLEADALAIALTA